MKLIIHTCHPARLVSTLEWWYRLALVGIQSLVLHGAEGKIDLAVGSLLPCESVLHPVLVITFREVFAGVGTTGFLAVGGSDGGLGPNIISLTT